MKHLLICLLCGLCYISRAQIYGEMAVGATLHPYSLVSIAVGYKLDNISVSGELMATSLFENEGAAYFGGKIGYKINVGTISLQPMFAAYLRDYGQSALTISIQGKQPELKRYKWLYGGYLRINRNNIFLDAGMLSDEQIFKIGIMF